MPQHNPHQSQRPRAHRPTHTAPARNHQRQRAPAGGPPPRHRRPPRRPRRRFLVILVALLLLGAIALGFFLFSGRKSAGPPWVIALDAGHGGDDVGAIGLIQEVELTETTVRHLEALLAADENFKPVLTRKLDKGTGVNDRTRKAKRSGAHLLLSVHGNSDESPDSNGFECFPAPPGREYHEDSLHFAQLLAAEMGAAGSRLRGEGGVRYAYYDESGQKTFAEISDVTEYEEKSFGVVENPDCPAVLVEQCFITNAADLAAFGGEEGCARAAACYYRAICAYFGTQPVA